MKAPYEAYPVVSIRGAYTTDVWRLCEECEKPLAWFGPVVLARIRGRQERRWFHFACYYGYKRWAKALRTNDFRSLVRWLLAMRAVVLSLQLWHAYPHLEAIDMLIAKARGLPLPPLPEEVPPR